MKKARMESPDIFIPLNYCQACGREDNETSTPAEFVDIFRELTQIEPVYFGTEIVFCENCHKTLDAFQAFRQMCDETQAILLHRASVKYEIKEDFIIEAVVEVENDPEEDTEEYQISDIELQEDTSNWFVCDICSKRFKTKNGLTSHINTVHLEKKIKQCHPCTIGNCRRKFNNKLSLECHVRVHEGKHPYECNICHLNLRSLSSLKNHLASHGNERPFKCLYCESTFTCDTNRYQHTMSVHKLGKQYVCPDCGYSCYNATAYGNHVKRVHGEAIYSCEQCGKKFRHPRNLAEHKETHDYVDRMLPCPECNKMFKKRRDVAMHVRIIHRKEKTHECQTCQKKFTLVAQLRKHVAVHTGEKPYACSLCTQAFTQNQALRRHMITHTGIKPFACPYCDHKFAEKYYMKKHANKCSMKPDGD